MPYLMNFSEKGNSNLKFLHLGNIELIFEGGRILDKLLILN